MMYGLEEKSYEILKFGTGFKAFSSCVLVKKKRRDTIVYVISVFTFYMDDFISWYPANTENCALLSTENCRDLAN
jgi:hypothetical protein